MTAAASTPLATLSTFLADAVARTADSVVSVLGRRRRSSSGFVWRPGVVVTASDALEQDEDILVVLADGRRVAATLAGRDASTDLAVLRISETQVPALGAAGSRELRTGEFLLAVGRQQEGVVARLAIVALAGGAWQSMRGGRIDRLIRLDRAISPREEGGVVLNADTQWIGMVVAGPRGAALAIPSATIERVAERLLAHGRVARGYLGLGLQSVQLDEALVRTLSLNERRGAIVINVDPNGPGHGAGILIGDIIVAWNTEPVRGVRDIFRRLTPEMVGQNLELKIIRGGEPRSITVGVGERPIAR
jgi:S1-C subfamily serine protease